MTHSAEKDAACRCGHGRGEHRRAWGPNSIGQYGHGLCINGWKVVQGYVFQRSESCHCEQFRRRWWRRWTRVIPPGSAEGEARDA